MSSPRTQADRRRDLKPEGCTDPALLEALTAPAIYGERRLQVEMYETHASWVFLAGEHAYKVKKPVAFGFLDYSTLSRRHAACREEVRVNQELAPGIYLGVRAIIHAGGGFRFGPDGTPGAVEYAVQMRRFDEADTLEGVIAAGALSHAHLRAVARRLLDFHRRTPVVTGGSPNEVLDLWRVNVDELGRLEHPDHWHIEIMRGFGEAFVNVHAREIERRARDGHVRDGHGDLRCEHVLLGRTVRVLDRIEFDPALRHMDVACDLAFLTMDLAAHRQHWAAQELVSGYRQAGGRPGSEILRCFYAAHWALVRAKVVLIAATARDGPANQEQAVRAERLWILAERLGWQARQPLVLVVCGPAASGKSVLAGELSQRSEMPVVSSDSVRKRLAHLAPSEPARQEHYSAGFTRATYRQLTHDAVLALKRQGSVIVDATCRSRGDRALLLGTLRRAAITHLVVRCEVTLELALERAAQRLHDPQLVSDATPQIAEQQFRSFEEFHELSDGSVLRLDTAQALDAQVAEIAGTVDRCLLQAGVSESREVPASALAQNA